MKILVAAPDQTFSRVGGLRTQVERTIEEIRNIGIEVDLFSPWETYNYKKYDVAHIFSMNTPCYFKADLFRGKLPLVFSSVMWRSGSRAKIRLLVELGIRSPYLLLNDVISCRKMSEWASSILPNTSEELEWLIEAIGVERKKCSIVPNGADDHFSQHSLSNLEESSGIKIDEDFVFCASVISTRKNLTTLADVCYENSLPLVVAGPVVDNSVANYINNLKGKGANIRLLGNLQNNSVELGYLYSKCRVFCLPSFYETPGIAALEAGLRGANIVITEVGGARDYFLDMAKYINPFDKQDIARKLLEAWKNGRIKDIEERLPNRIRSEYSWTSVAKKTVDAYHNI